MEPKATRTGAEMPGSRFLTKKKGSHKVTPRYQLYYAILCNSKLQIFHFFFR